MKGQLKVLMIALVFNDSPGDKSLILKVKDNISWYNFSLGSVSKDFTKDEQSEISLNVVYATFLLVCFVCQKESTCETRKNVFFYFILKALFLLDITKF